MSWFKKLRDFTSRYGSRDPPLPINPPHLSSELGYRFGHMTHSHLIGIIGKVGCGRNTLACRFKNMHINEPLSPDDVQNRVKHTALIDLSTREFLQMRGNVLLEMRLVPPDVFPSGPRFFSSSGGEAHRCHALVFCVDLGDRDSIGSFMIWVSLARRKLQPMLPFITVGNKLDQKIFEPTETGFVRGHSEFKGGRGYFECSALQNRQVSPVLDAILGMVL